MKYTILILFIAVCISSFGQGTNKLKLLNDSLIHELEVSDVDTTRANIMLQLAENLLYTDPDSAIYYGEKTLQLAKKQNYIHVQLGAMGFIGNTLMNGGDLPRALEIGFEAIEMAKGVPIRVAAGIGPTLDNIGWIYYLIGDYEKAILYFNKMIEMGNDDVVGVAFGYKNLAMVFEKLDLLDSAMLCLDISLQKFSTLNHSFFPTIYTVTPEWYNLRAGVYLKQNKPELALKDLFTTLRMTLQNDDAYHSANTYNDISLYYKRLLNSDSTIFYAEKGLAEASKISYDNAILNASEILADQYESIDPVKALFYSKLSSQTRNGIYGAGNIQIMRDMIDQNEKKQRELETAKLESRNRIRLNSLLGSLFTLLLVAVLLYRNNRSKHKAKQKIESAFDQLKSTQSQLIQSEKMASLGELTAGIAHEIQNPLNFVNNFSEVSTELVDEMQDELNMNNPDVVREIAVDLKQNLQKINHHGQRASGIVKGMLEHSRTSDGKKEPTDLNALADEYLRLAYHGLRAKDKIFNADFKTEFDEALPKVNVIPQDIGRVLLNLINNAFFAVNQKAQCHSEQSKESYDYQPEVMVSTKLSPSEGGKGEDIIEITVSDNGPGIPDEIIDKIFQPFFTTKPTGSGTGLGLSLSYDIVKAHSGELIVDSKEGQGTMFKIILSKNYLI